MQETTVMEKMNWMVGMTDHMMSMCMQDQQQPLMQEMYNMTSAMMGNLNHMKMLTVLDKFNIDLMEPMMRSLEETMKRMDMHNEQQMSMIKNMMHYMLMMQMHMLMNAMR